MSIISCILIIYVHYLVGRASISTVQNSKWRESFFGQGKWTGTTSIFFFFSVPPPVLSILGIASNLLLGGFKL